jgi:hypothetical protein
MFIVVVWQIIEEFHDCDVEKFLTTHSHELGNIVHSLNTLRYSVLKACKHALSALPPGAIQECLPLPPCNFATLDEWQRVALDYVLEFPSSHTPSEVQLAYRLRVGICCWPGCDGMPCARIPWAAAEVI